MRAFHVIGAAFLMAWAMPATSHADGTAATGTVSAAPAPGCHCPALQHRHAWRPRRHARSYAWHRRHWAPAPVAAAPPPPWPAYNPPIPSPDDSAYDRVMTQYMRAREWDGEYLVEPGYVPSPPLPGLPRFVVAAGGGVFEYDIMADGYVQLSQSDAQRALAVTGPLH
jgi:hypothetical protein